MALVLILLTALLVFAAYGHLAVALRGSERTRRVARAARRVRDERRAFELSLMATTLLTLSWIAYLIGNSHSAAAVAGDQLLAVAGSSSALLLALAAWFSWRRADQLRRIPFAATLVAASGTLLMIILS